MTIWGGGLTKSLTSINGSMAVKVTEPSMIKNEQIYGDIWKTEVGNRREKANSYVFSPFLDVEES